MPVDFGMYPPEVNSSRMYTGPGPGPMLAAAQAWDAVTDELFTAAAAFGSTVSELAPAAWSGPSSTAMAASAERHVAWLSATAAHAEHTAGQARTAAAAFEAAFAATVPPVEVAANRDLLATLVMTNFFGQNTPAIAATEALYGEMWAQDALAMYTYAASSATAAVLTPFGPPSDIAASDAVAAQAAEVAQGATSAATQPVSALATPAAADDLPTLAALIALLLNAPGDFAAIIALAPVDALTGFAEVPPAIFTSVSGILDDDTFSAYNGEEPWPDTRPGPVTAFPANLPNPPPGVLSGSSTAAEMGEADAIGRLSVPAGWTVAAPEVRAAAPEVRAVAWTTSLAEMPAAEAAQLHCGAAMAGQAMVGSAPPQTGQAATTVTHARRSRSGPSGDHVVAMPARKVVTGVVAAIRDLACQRAEGLLTDAQYDARKKALLEDSFVLGGGESWNEHRGSGPGN